VPPPGPGEVRVRSITSAISHGTEMLVYRGEVPEGTALDLPTFAGDFSFPIKHGYATVGRVTEAGPGVEHLSPNDLVFAHHPHQETFTVPAAMPVSLPDGTDPSAGVFFANLETALNVVHDTPLHLGETALVFGQGVVGLLVTQLLKRAGADRVLAVEPMEGRRELALEVGADAAFEPDEDLLERVQEATGGRGADVAVEASSSGAALQAAVDAVAVEGTVVVASWYGTKPVTLSLGGHFHRGRVKVRSSQVGRISPELGPRWDRARRTEAVLGLLPRLRLKELVSHRIPFEDAPRAYRLVDEEPGETVQVILLHDYP
jgi:2-desacetyl-2-hydroxyethyl bacteriochlorophyllide A dehydrogenase